MWDKDDHEIQNLRKSYWKKYILIFIIVIGALISWFYLWQKDLDRLPRSSVITESTSPDGKYTVIAYETDAGATTNISLLCELKFNNLDKKNKTIYYHYGEEGATLKWIDNDTININGHLLNVPSDVYESRESD